MLNISNLAARWHYLPFWLSDPHITYTLQLCPVYLTNKTYTIIYVGLYIINKYDLTLNLIIFNHLSSKTMNKVSPTGSRSDNQGKNRVRFDRQVKPYSDPTLKYPHQDQNSYHLVGILDLDVLKPNAVLTCLLDTYP